MKPARAVTAALATGLAALLLVTGCSTQPQGSNVDPDQLDSVDPPEVGACRLLTPDDVALPANAGEVVDCADRHTAETYHVVDLPKEYDDAAYDDPDLARYAYDECASEFATFIGADESLVLRTTISWAWFRPSEQAWGNDARWIRCDVIGGGAEADAYVALPKTAKALLTGRPDDRWLACAKGASFESATKVPCSKPHDWRAVATVKLGEPGEPYPGDRVSASRTDAFCAKQVEAWLNYPAEWNFGITWFHKAEWEAGNRRSICWAQTTE